MIVGACNARGHDACVDVCGRLNLHDFHARVRLCRRGRQTRTSRLCLATLALRGPPPRLPAVAIVVPGRASCLRAAPGGQCPMDRWGSKALAKEKGCWVDGGLLFFIQMVPGKRDDGGFLFLLQVVPGCNGLFLAGPGHDNQPRRAD